MKTFPRASCFVFALILALLVRRTHSFADYLLGGGGCWTELSPDEVIMNHAVMEADHVEVGANLRIVVEGHDADNNDNPGNQQVTLLSFPQTVKVQVVGGEHLKDYQYVIDVVEAPPEGEAGDPANNKKGPLATFDGGKCNDQKRVAGRAKDGPRTLIVHKAGATIVAGWASGHEAVKLTPSVTFVAETGGSQTGQQAPGDAKHPSEPVNAEPGEWVSALIEGCPEVVEALQVGTFPIVHSTVKLQASKAERENQVQLKWPTAALLPPPNSRKLVLVSSSTDATFEGGVCGGLSAPQGAGPRAVVSSDPTSHEVPIPVLSIHKPHTITVYAYSFDANTRSIQRTDPFVLQWVPDDNNQKKQHPPTKEKEAEGDPQKLADAKVRADPHLLHQQAHAYRGKDRAMDKTGSSSGKVPPVHADDRDAMASPDEMRHRHNHHLSQEESVVDDNAASLDQQHLGRRKEGAGVLMHPKIHPNEDGGEQQPKPPLHRRGFHHALLHHRDAGTGSGRSAPFTVTSSYYAGVAILVVAPVAVVQMCLRASRKAKGRRTL